MKSIQDELPDEWTEAQRALFTRMYRHMIEFPGAFKHPDTPPQPQNEWNTTAWNASWMAAVFMAGPNDIIHVFEDASQASLFDFDLSGRLQ